MPTRSKPAPPAPATTPARRSRRPSPGQLERREATRRKLLEAAGQMIGKYGFAGCTIARVTARARIAHGTFYLHFQSQQEMFEELLREMSLRMLEHVRDAVHECGSLVELERRGLEANHDFFCRYPFMARLTQEAELYSPVSYTAHIDAMANGYVRALARKRAGTVLEGWSHAQLEQLAVMLIGARSQIMRRYGVAGHKVVPLSPDVIDTYIRFISNGILAGLDKPAADRTEGAQAPTGERD
ncbi:MAG TPA: TetR/AcrR family transcriptional regulator [Novosphingobium sp.]|nr:TetR/AcrR family transcriptional regulator [Novosphingobium sp.]HZV09938.1 TetR/AcrR family transcriptional regulator [Novosphingobium sp.]